MLFNDTTNPLPSFLQNKLNEIVGQKSTSFTNCAFSFKSVQLRNTQMMEYEHLLCSWFALFFEDEGLGRIVSIQYYHSQILQERVLIKHKRFNIVYHSFLSFDDSSHYASNIQCEIKLPSFFMYVSFFHIVSWLMQMSQLSFSTVLFTFLASASVN